jgi:hypothetical protein
MSIRKASVGEADEAAPASPAPAADAPATLAPTPQAAAAPEAPPHGGSFMRRDDGTLHLIERTELTAKVEEA